MKKDIPLYISKSQQTTLVNKTGSWRFVRPQYNEKTAPCSTACPAGEDIARIEMLVSQGMFQEAWETILKENPFPAVCGRVCFHMCEGACNRKEFDEPVAIHNLERIIGDMAVQEDYPVPRFNIKNCIKKRIAIAGAGPAGLSAAWFLTRLGYACDIYEAEEEPGGVLRWGIPSYRLPSHILKDEIARIKALGVNIYCGHPVNSKILENVSGRYDAVFIGCGYGRSLTTGIPGEEMASDGLDFLKDIRRGETNCIQCVSAVIGGGNTAIDVVRSLIRIGAKPVLIYRRRREDMPAFSHEVDMALEEGVEIRELLAPVSIQAERGEYVLTLQKMKALDMNTKTGRTRVVPDEDKTETIRVAQVFTAIGAEPSESWYIPPKDQDDVLYLSHCTFQDQKMPVVFGGDLTAKTKSVADAIASGKQAAMALDTYFREGRHAIMERLDACRVGAGPSLSMEIYLGGERRKRSSHIVSFEELNKDYFSHMERHMPHLLSPEGRIQSFIEIEQRFNKITAIEEAARCFNCGICNECDNCRLYCPEVAILAEATRFINLDYCKGCGICVAECPRNAMSLEEEKV